MKKTLKPNNELHTGNNTQRYLKISFVTSGILIVLYILILSVLQLTSIPKICSTCHEMAPEYVTWQASSHNKLTCTECHTGTASKSIITATVSGLRLGYKHVTGRYLMPITTEPIKDEVCQKCHDLKGRVVTPSGDIKIPHDRHTSLHIACIECHSGVTHGNIALRQQTIDQDFARWTSAMGKAQMAVKFKTPAMQKCMECHKEKGVATTCESCHKKIETPANHLTTEWINQGVHGKEARADLESCDKCHSFTNQPQVMPGLDKVTAYTRTNTFCYDCHTKKPTSHEESWRATHGSRASGEQKANCITCHSDKPAKSSQKTTKTYCQQCHNSQHQLFNPGLHPVPIDKSTKLTAACVKCHTSKTCGRCHYIPRP